MVEDARLALIRAGTCRVNRTLFFLVERALCHTKRAQFTRWRWSKMPDSLSFARVCVNRILCFSIKRALFRTKRALCHTTQSYLLPDEPCAAVLCGCVHIHPSFFTGCFVWLFPYILISFHMYSTRSRLRGYELKENYFLSKEPYFWSKEP